MYRATIVVVVAFAACVQVIAGATLETALAVDIVAQKLEDHLYGVNLDNKITLDECKAAFNEFEQWDRQTYAAKIHEGPLAVARDYLSDFLHKYLENDIEGRLTEEFVEKLEGTYEKARPSYSHKAHRLQCEEATTQTPKTCALVASLTGKGEPVTVQMIEDSFYEMDDMANQIFVFPEEGRIYENVDEFLELFRVYNTPEIDVAGHPIMQLLTEESEEKLNQRDSEEIQKYMDTYKNELAKYLSLVQE